MQLVGTFNKGFRFLSCVIEIYTKCARVISLKGKKGVAITNAFQKILDQSHHKPNKIWIDRGSEFHNRLIKSFLQNTDIEMHSTHNEVKSVIAERFIKTWKKQNL